jgi:Uma2 family endonuclease
MPTVKQDAQLLEHGDFLSRDEFMRRWEAMPHVKRAELIRGVVYMPSPLSREHAVMDTWVATWLGTYAAFTAGCEPLSNATWRMAVGDAPQPDTSLRILPECGGQSRTEGRYVAGAPEFLAEVCISSTAYDLHQKLDLYQEAGVQEYLAVLMHEHEVRWHRLTDGRFEVLPPPADGVYRSAVFPGLWLDAPALLAGYLARVLAVLNDGIQSPEHQQFVEQLAARRRA